MWQGLDRLLHTKKPAGPWNEADVRHWVNQYLMQETKSNDLYCESASGGQLIVRVASALLKQEVLLLEYDLKRLLKDQGQWLLTELIVRY